MANDYFRFRQFTVHQSLCAMKVGTDGTLLGCWAEGGRRILDIGTGTGLIAQMMAQRFPDAGVTGIDIDEGAVLQARQNVAESPFAHRIRIERCDLADEQGEYDCLVSNPPYFVDSLASPDARRTMARHADTLSYAALISHGWRLLSDGGVLSVVIPFDCKARLETEAALAGFFKTRECAVKTTPAKSPRRYLLAFRKHSQELERGELVIGSEAYVELTKEFYL
ncbi:MAG: methyltransferase [Prevotella sp.]|nr:methyltransferase [Prevotella sp.]